jgi:hypothetical protein
MNDALEEFLNQVTPRGACPELRESTLAAANDTLAKPQPRRWDLWCGVASAAALVLGVGLNFWVIRVDERRFAELYGPEPLPRHLAEATESIESVTNSETGGWVRGQWRTALASRRPSANYVATCIRRHYQSILDELAVVRKEPSHGEEDHQVDRDRPRRPDGDTTRHLRHPCLHYQYAA